MIKVSTLKKNPNNPRLLRDDKFEKLKNSLREFPQMMSLRPIIVDTENIVLGGNMRLEAIKVLGMKEIPDEWVKRADDLTEAQKQEFIVKDNVGFGEWDWDALGNSWSDLPLEDWGLDVPNFEMVEDAPEEDESAVAETISKAKELQAKWGTESGQLWKLGEHRLLCGDSTKREDAEKVLEGKQAQMCLTDPPYNVFYGAGSDPRHKIREIQNDNLGGDFPQFLSLVLLIVLQNVSGGIYVFMSDKEFATMFKILEELKAHWSSTIVWVKDQLVLSPKDYHSRHELIWYGWRKDGKRLPLTDRTQTDIWEFPRPKVSEEHPTMKPVDLVAKAVENSSVKNDLVYEPFSGSGTTLIACEQLNRKCRAIEIAPEYVAVTLERWQILTSKTPELIDE